MKVNGFWIIPYYPYIMDNNPAMLYQDSFEGWAAHRDIALDIQLQWLESPCCWCWFSSAGGDDVTSYQSQNLTWNTKNGYHWTFVSFLGSPSFSPE